jgi:hypothetical protein
MVRPEIKSAAPEEDHQHCEAVDKYQELLVPRYQVKRSIQASSLCSERCEGAINSKRNAFIRPRSTGYYHSCSYCLTVPVHTSVDSRDHSVPLELGLILMNGSIPMQHEINSLANVNPPVARLIYPGQLGIPVGLQGLGLDRPAPASIDLPRTS